MYKQVCANECLLAYIFFFGVQITICTIIRVLILSLHHVGSMHGTYIVRSHVWKQIP